MDTILNHQEVQHKIRRIAYQIYEANATEKEIVLAGIAGGGYTLAQRLAETLQDIAPMHFSLCKVEIDKADPRAPITTSMPAADYENKAVVLIDDVLNSGTTLIYGVRHFLDVPLSRFKTAVLVNRNHKKYPVKADFKGISLSTSLNENVAVVFEKDQDRVCLE
ncbi:phosphoribosyltransferase family protein [Gilvibacter sp.]|uniref:phosphoribosyltransferase family protein n=1 Tax=Gilvibacter sp. TaxID=2729997 RepID=UPI003F4A80B2